ncbi:AAA family ATPase [Mycolicibacterium farcinogenes]|nr:AAA family ATPase [Mycolicibacterium farcinogenes]
MGQLTVVTGANGSGKSSVYRALRLLADCGRGEVIGSLAREGGLQSARWAGKLRSDRPVELELGYAADDFGYLIDLGLPVPARSMFDRDPQIKREIVFTGPVLRPASTPVRRAGPLGEKRCDSGRGFEELARGLAAYRSVLSEFSDPERLPELSAVRDRLRSWRFYDGFRVDADAAARRPQIGTRTPTLADDGADLAAALQTIPPGGGQQFQPPSMGGQQPGYSGGINSGYPGLDPSNGISINNPAAQAPTGQQGGNAQYPQQAQPRTPAHGQIPPNYDAPPQQPAQPPSQQPGQQQPVQQQPQQPAQQQEPQQQADNNQDTQKVNQRQQQCQDAAAMLGNTLVGISGGGGRGPIWIEPGLDPAPTPTPPCPQCEPTTAQKQPPQNELSKEQIEQVLNDPSVKKYIDDAVEKSSTNKQPKIRNSIQERWLRKWGRRASPVR